ncbi:histone deacetylase complex subunit SAP18 isoform X2 [Prosopis cineraria]|uniref:histone deacetylase complex subunit SAP18 isoform X2 n=1 Tax=Prosopis cineraria TaxID=364024 RepID=UPI0024100EDF|nr:histone deacetylase complex subunit SAP18 isoform X2 [Prosopis cineraria]
MRDAPKRQGGRPLSPPARGPPPPPPPPRPRFEPVDREKTCPLLLRVFTKVKEVAPAARRRNAKLSFAFVYPDKHGRFLVREVGKAFSYGNGRLDDGKALAELGFEIGDYLDVAIL